MSELDEITLESPFIQLRSDANWELNVQLDFLSFVRDIEGCSREEAENLIDMWDGAFNLDDEYIFNGTIRQCKQILKGYAKYIMKPLNPTQFSFHIPFNGTTCNGQGVINHDHIRIEDIMINLRAFCDSLGIDIDGVDNGMNNGMNNGMIPIDAFLVYIANTDYQEVETYVMNVLSIILYLINPLPDEPENDSE